MTLQKSPPTKEQQDLLLIAVKVKPKTHKRIKKLATDRSSNVAALYQEALDMYLEAQ